MIIGVGVINDRTCVESVAEYRVDAQVDEMDRISQNTGR